MSEVNSSSGSAEHTYLSVPPDQAMRPCIGLVLAGMAARANIGVGNLEDAVDLLEGFHSPIATTRFRFTLADEGVLAQVVDGASALDDLQTEESNPEAGWRTVIELVS